VLAEEALKLNALLIHYSTDYVFDGTKTDPYIETDTPNPINAYGRTKLEGELAIQGSQCRYLIFRTSWVYGTRGNNFLLTILKVASQKEKISVVDDQLGTPTTAQLIADTTSICIFRAIADIKNSKFESGLYHLTSTGNSSWYMMAEYAITYAKDELHRDIITKEIVPIPTSQYPTKAQRPLNSALNVKKIETEFGIRMPSWDDILRLTLEDLR
jgi:dTDP-4-dehydrorhamnose reductase